MKIRKYFALLLMVLVFVTPVRAEIRDDAEIFSPAAEQEASQIIAELARRTNPPKKIVVHTAKSVSGDVQRAAEEAFRAGRVDGVQVFMTLEPKRLVVTTGRETQTRFTSADQVRNMMLQEFKGNRFDEGLTRGVSFIADELVRDFGAAASSASASRVPVERAPYPVADTERESSSGGFGTILFIGLGLLALFLFLGRRRQQFAGGNQMGAPGAGARAGGFGGGGGGGGGGWGSSILGGLGGALMGNWLYDRFSGGSNDAHASQSSNDGSYDSHSGMGDGGDVGSSSVGDWSDSGSDSGDSGGGGGDDW